MAVRPTGPESRKTGSTSLVLSMLCRPRFSQNTPCSLAWAVASKVCGVMSASVQP